MIGWAVSSAAAWLAQWDVPPGSQTGGAATRYLAQAGQAPVERDGERVVGGDALVPVVVNGRSLNLRIEPGAPGLLLVAPALAPELGLNTGKPGFFSLGVCYRVGRETTCGRTETVRLQWPGEKPGKRRIGWMSRPYQPAADGTVGPAWLPDAVVRFQFRPARAEEETAMLALRGGGLFGAWSVLEGTTTIAGVPLRVRFDPHHARSLLNASAAIALAAANGGAMTAETGRQEIAFGIERPFRVMRLARPLRLGGLSLASLGVRVTDGNVAGRIAEEGAAAEAADPNEVVVTAGKGKPPVNALSLGADALDRCSSLVFDKRAREVRLTCGDAPA